MKSLPWREFDVDADKIEQLRVKVYEYARSHSDEIDIEDVRRRIVPPEDVANNNLDLNNNDSKITNWMLKRFLISAHKEVDGALAKFVEFFTLRKQYHMSQMTDQNVLPKELFQLQAFNCEGQDKQGNRTFVVRLKYYRKLPQFDFLIKRGILFYAEKLDLEYERGLCDGVCIVLDCTDFGLTNLDMDMLQFISKQLPFNYSGIVRSMLVYEVHYLLRHLFAVVESWLPNTKDKDGNKRKLFHSVSKKNIDDYIEPDQRPHFFADGSIASNTPMPDNSVPFEKMINQVQGFEQQNAKKIQQYLDQLCKA